MMQSNRNNPRKGAKFMDTKVLIASLSVAVTVGVWNLLSHDAYSAEKVTPKPIISPPPQSQTGTAQDFPPLPTVMPLLQITMPQPQAVVSAQVANKGQAQLASQTTQLRSVAAPTQVIVQKAKPVFVQPVQIVNVVGGGGGGGGGGGTSAASPVTATKSSK